MKPLRFIVYNFFFILLFFSYIQITAQTESEKPEKVHRIRKVMMSNEWYKNQAELWNKELDKNPKNEDAWYNYYLAVRYANIPYGENTEYRQIMDKFIPKMEKSIPDSYVYYYIKYFYRHNWDSKDVSLLEKAYELNPDEPEILLDLVVYYEVNGDKEKAKELCKKVYQTEDIAPAHLNYHYNVLISAEKNAILFTNGDLDTYSCWLLQRAKEIRKDVTVLNTSLIRIKRYLELLLNERNIKIDIEKLPKGKTDIFIPALCKAITENNPEIPIYFALTVTKSTTKSIIDNLYMVGLAQRYSEKRFDNIALLRKNVEKNFMLDYLKYDWYNETDISRKTVSSLSQNYIPSFLVLYDHYKASEENSKADYFRTFAIKLAEVSPKMKKKLEEYFDVK